MPKKIQATNIEMTALNSQVVFISNPTRSNWLSRRRIFIVISLALLGAAGIAGISIYLTNKAFNDTELFTNQSSRSLWSLHKHIQETDFRSCTPEFAKHWTNFTDCGSSLCDCVRNARDAFGKQCPMYAQNLSPSKCLDVASTIQGCKEFMSADYDDC